MKQRLKLISRALGLSLTLFILGLLINTMRWFGMYGGDLYMNIGGIASLILLGIRFYFREEKPLSVNIKYMAIGSFILFKVLAINYIFRTQSIWLDFFIVITAIYGIMADIIHTERRIKFFIPAIGVSFLLTTIGMIFKILHWPFASEQFIIGMGLAMVSIMVEYIALGGNYQSNSPS